MPPKRRGRPPKDKGDPPPAKKPKQSTSIVVIDPTPTPVTSGPDAPTPGPSASEEKPGTSKSPDASKKVASKGKRKKTKVLNSTVHKEFIQEEKEDANGNKVWSSKCKHCPPGQGEYNDRQASHLKDHLKKNHVDIFQMVEDQDEQERQALEKRVKIKDKQGRCLNRFIDLFANTGLPLSMADNPYMKSLLKEMDPDMKFPGRKGTTTLLVKDKYGTMYCKMIALMKRARVIHPTTDCWSNSNCRTSYIGFTGHCYDPLTKTRKSFRMALREFRQSHTADNIIKKAVEVFKEFDIKHKVRFFSFFKVQEVSY